MNDKICNERIKAINSLLEMKFGEDSRIISAQEAMDIATVNINESTKKVMEDLNNKIIERSEEGYRDLIYNMFLEHKSLDYSVQHIITKELMKQGYTVITGSDYRVLW